MIRFYDNSWRNDATPHSRGYRAMGVDAERTEVLIWDWATHEGNIDREVCKTCGGLGFLKTDPTGRTATDCPAECDDGYQRPEAWSRGALLTTASDKHNEKDRFETAGEAFLVARCLVVIDALCCPRPPKEFSLSMHLDEEYRIANDATDHWIGAIEDSGANEIVALDGLISAIGFARAKSAAQAMLSVLNVPE